MTRKSVPACLWDFALVWISESVSRLARGKDGLPGMEQITGTSDISEWLDFDLYDLMLIFLTVLFVREMATWYLSTPTVGGSCSWNGRTVPRTGFHLQI
jgi:hypothetical protein